MIETTKKLNLSEAEMRIADIALTEYDATGKADVKCPRCASPLKIEIGASAERVSCVNCDFRMTVRGI